MYKIIIISILTYGASQAFAQSVEQSAGADMITPLRVVETSPVEFGVIAPDPNVASTVRLSKDNSIQCNSGAICFGGHSRGEMEITGEPGRAVYVAPIADITLQRQGGPETMLIRDITNIANDWDTNVAIYSSGFKWIHIGGTLDLDANQEPGRYEGNFIFTAEYQ